MRRFVARLDFISGCVSSSDFIYVHFHFFILKKEKKILAEDEDVALLTKH